MSDKPTQKMTEAAKHPGSKPLDPEVWVDQHGDYLFRYALFRVRDPVLAEDLVQETLLAALEARHNFAGQSSERTWLVGILKHKMIDHFRKTSREHVVNDVESLPGEQGEFFDERAHWKPELGPTEWVDPIKAVEQKEFWDILEKCLSELPPRQASAFSLREMDELSSKEVCKVLNVSANNLWVMLHRARMHLRQCLETNWFGQKVAKG